MTEQIWKHHLTTRHISTGCPPDFVRASFGLMGGGKNAIRFEDFKLNGKRVVEAAYEFLSLDVLKQNKITERGLVKFLAVRGVRGEPADQLAKKIFRILSDRELRAAQNGAGASILPEEGGTAEELDFAAFVHKRDEAQLVQVFLRLDKARTGSISESAFVEYYIETANPTVARDVFKSLDLNSAGFLTLEDIVKAEVAFRAFNMWMSVTSKDDTVLNEEKKLVLRKYYGAYPLPHAEITIKDLVNSAAKTSLEYASPPPP
jgi:hypothetical protein